ncbi:MAG: LptF/LptG family permease [Treponema sp.]|nr:LptF/LptG family permease [Treponema sp.]
MSDACAGDAPLEKPAVAARRGAEMPRGFSFTIYKYILGETLFSFAISFAFFFLVFVLNQLLLLAQDILARQVPVGEVALLMLFSLPSVVALSAPFATLLGTLLTIGRLSGDNEIMVMLASGFSLRNVFLPALTVGVAVSLVAFVTNDILLPAGTLQFRALYRRILVSTPALEMASNSVIRFRDTVIVTGDVSGSTIGDVLIFDRTGDGERRVLMAGSAELRDSGREGLSLDLSDAFMQSSREIGREDFDYAFADLVRYWVPQEEIMQAMVAIGPREMSSVDVFREIRAQELDLAARVDDRLATITSIALSLEGGLRGGPGSPDWSQRLGHLASLARETEILRQIRSDGMLAHYRLEFNQKFSLPFGALALVFLAIPLGLFSKKSGQTMGVFFGLLISVVYWTMFVGGQAMGLRMDVPPFVAMWTANISVVAAGLVLALIRATK